VAQCSSTDLFELPAASFVFILVSDEGIKIYFVITFRVYGVIEGNADDYQVSWYGAPHTNFLIM
jgi:hypothetical protein